MENIKDTNYDFTLVLRQMHTEAILREKIAAIGASYHQSVECLDFQVDASAPLGAPGVTSTFINRKTQRTFKLKSKYLIGADGGRSFVRRHAQIPFDGDTSEDRWIRIDGIVETDMPLNRAYGQVVSIEPPLYDRQLTDTHSAIESRTHGNVLWAPLDNGATRIGYAFSSEIAAKYPDGVTQEVALQEAIECMKPFKVEFKEVHWWTLYTIGQRIARDFSTPDRRIFLAGDAAHTHSSGAAQGLNTGIHDAVNLGWKLALQIRGIAKDEVLDTYSAERMTAVQQLINYDKDIATLMSHKWPSWYKGDPSADPYLALGELFEKAAPFNTGLGITYPANILNQAGSSTLAVLPGSRPPDVELMMPGINRGVRLQRVTANFAKFFVVIFTGDIDSTRSSIQELERYLSEKGKDLEKNSAIGWITISPVTGCSPFEALGTHPLGNAYYDPTRVAHEKFGIDAEKGNAVILRPDGLVGSGGAISGPWIREYFSKVLKL